MEKKLEVERANNRDPLVAYHFQRLQSDDPETAMASRIYIRNNADEVTVYRTLVELEAKRFEYNQKLRRG